jgi:hypothetical protein
MMGMDEWGRDPSVQAMRKVFKAMETSLEEILKRLDISPYDNRIREWLEKALAKFERSWSVAHQMGIPMDEETAPAVYARCFAKVIGSEGIEIPRGLLPQEKEAERLVHEVFK